MIFGRLAIGGFTTLVVFVTCLVWSHLLLWFVLIPFSFLNTSNICKQFLGIVATTIGVLALFYFRPDIQERLMLEEDPAQYFYWVKDRVLAGILLGATTSILAFMTPVKM